MSAEKFIAPVAEFRPGDIPYGKGLLLDLALIPGKLTATLMRQLVAVFGKPTTAEKAAQLSKIGGVLGLGVNSFLAWLFNRGWFRRLVGETGSEALAVGMVMAAIDKLYPTLTVSAQDTDLSDVVSNKAVDKLMAAIGKGGAIGSPELGSPELSSQLSGFPETQSSAFAPEESYAGPELGSPDLGSPEAEDPVQELENILAQKSQS